MSKQDNNLTLGCKRSEKTKEIIKIFILISIYLLIIIYINNIITSMYKLYEKGDFKYSINNNDEIIIEMLSNNAKGKETIHIPSEIDGYPVVSIKNLYINDENNSLIKTIEIPDTIKEMDRFSYLKNLLEINVNEKNKYYSSNNGILYNKNKTELIFYPGGKTNNEFIISNNVIKISLMAFNENNFLKKIVLGDNIAILDSNTFCMCEELTELVIHKESKLTTIKNKAFNYNKNLNNLYLPKTLEDIETGAFYACEDLDTFDLSDNDNFIISNNALITNKEAKILLYYLCFEGCENRTYAVEEGIKIIGEYAFISDFIKTLELPSTLKTIEENAFHFLANEQIECKSVKPPTGVECFQKIFVPLDYIDNYKNLKNKFDQNINVFPNIKNDCYYYYEKNNQIFISGYYGHEETLIMPDYIIDKPIVSVDGIYFCGVKELTLPKYIKIINDLSFNHNLQKITLGSELEEIGETAFAWSNSLKEVIFTGNKLTKIGNQAFDSTSIEAIDIPSSVKQIGYCCFKSCNSLEKIIIRSKHIFDEGVDYSGIYCGNLNDAGQYLLTMPLLNIYINDDLYYKLPFDTYVYWSYFLIYNRVHNNSEL